MAELSLTEKEHGRKVKLEYYPTDLFPKDE